MAIKWTKKDVINAFNEAMNPQLENPTLPASLIDKLNQIKRNNGMRAQRGIRW